MPVKICVGIKFHISENLRTEAGPWIAKGKEIENELTSFNTNWGTKGAWDWHVTLQHKYYTYLMAES